MRKTLIFSIILLCTVNLIYSQIPIGFKYDCNGYAFNGYFDPLTYSPNEKLTKVHNSDSYEVGYYYDSLGNKIEGQIKFENDKIFFKKENEEFRDKIRPEEIKYFVIGVDSFFVTSNFHYKNKLKTNPEFVQYITEFNGLTFAKHYNFTSGIAQQYAMQPPIIETFLVKAKDSTTWENFPDNNRFKESALKYFSYIPYLKEKINSGDYKSENMLSIIKMAEYNYKYNNSKPIYYDKYWQEINDGRKSKYYAKIISKRDSIWTFEYFEDTTKLFLANYSSFYPNNKNGEFISYYLNGEIRQIVTFKNNKPKDFKTFNKSGDLNRDYQYIETKDTTTGKTSINVKYLSVIDSLGENIINSDISHNLIEKDNFSNVSYFNKFNNKELIASYRIIENDTVFQIINPDYNFKIKSLQKKFDYYMSEKKYDLALSENAQGIILVSLIIDKKGNVITSIILNHIHPEIDKLVDGFIKTRLLPEAEYIYKFKPYKVDKIEQFCEVVIPFEFSINRFYRQPVNYNQFNNMYWIHQQQMMNMIPRIPSGF